MSKKLRINQFVNLSKRFLKNPKSVISPLYYGSLQTDMESKVKTKYRLPKGIPTVDIMDLVPGFHETVDPFTYLDQTSLPIDIALLKALAKKIKARRYLEIGSWRGESLANVADVVKECYSISLDPKELKKRGASDDYIKIQNFFSKNKKNIKIIYHDSHTMDYSVFKEKFDLIFVDGDHSYEGVKLDTEKVFGLLRDEDSMIVWHDCGAGTENFNWFVLAGILDGSPKDKIKNIYKVSNSLCAVYTTKTLKTSYPEFPTEPNKRFIIDIDAEKI